MSMISKGLREERAGLASKMAEIVKAGKESPDGCMNAEQREQFDRIDADQMKLKDRIESFERQEKFEAELLDETRSNKGISKYNPVKTNPSKNFQTWCKAKADLLSLDEAREFEASGLNLRSDRFIAEYSPKWKQHIEYRSTVPDSTTANVGGEFLPTQLADFVSSYQTAIFDVRTISRNITTEGIGAFVVPTSDDTANSATLITQATADVVLTVPTNKITLNGYCFTSKIVQITFELLNSAAIDVQQWFAQELGMRFARGRASSLCTGTGSSQPQGYAIGATTGTQLTTKSAITYADALAALYSVPIYYRANASWVVSDSLMQQMRAMVSTTGFPLWSVNVAANQPDTFLGKPIFVDPYLAAMGSTSVTVGVVGDFSQYLVRNCNPPYEVATSKERYFEQRLLALVAFAWFDAHVLQANALQTIYTPSS